MSNDIGVWAFGLCCNQPETPPPANDPPTISFASDPITGDNGIWTLNRPIGSENNVFGVWQDVDNVDGVTFRFLIRSNVPGKPDRDITSDLIDISPGDIYSQNQQPWAISWDGFVFSDDFDILVAEITDDQGQVATAEVQLQMPIDDIARYYVYDTEQARHPKPRQGNWGRVNIGYGIRWSYDIPSFVANPQPEWFLGAGGYSVGSKLAVSDIQGSAFAIEYFNTTTDKYLIPLPGFRFLIPDGSRLRCYYEHRPPFNVGPPIEAETISIAGPQLRDSNFLSGVEDLNFFPLGAELPVHAVELAPNESIVLVFWGELWDANSEVSTPSEDPELVPWLEFSELLVYDSDTGTIYDVDKGSESVAPISGPVATYDTAFEWDASVDTTYPAIWSAYRDSLPLGIYDRPSPEKSGTGANFRSEPFAMAWATGGGYEVPTLDSQGFLCPRYEPAQDAHNQVLPVSVHPLFDSFYIRPYRDFAFQTTVSLGETGGNWGSANWVVIADFHPGSFGATWSPDASRSPIIGIYVDDPTGSNQWVVYARGSTETDPTGYTRTSFMTLPFAGVGTYNLSLEGRIDHTGQTSYLKAWINGEFMGEINHEIGINAGGKTETGGVNPKVGTYASLNSSTQDIFTRISYVRVQEITFE